MRSLRLRRLALAAVLVSAAGCNMNVRFDPEGFRCDPGGSCPNGYACVDGVCHRGGTTDKCTGVVCNMPPAATCADANTSRTFTGRCDAATGTCAYDPLDAACAAGCEAGLCKDACAGVSCVTPPAATCVDATHLRTFAMTGTCAAGQCTYQPTDTTCPNGCANARCTGANLCMNVTCNMPPAPTCVGASLRSFDASGTCDMGTGMCTYPATDAPCANGCAGGACVTPSLAFTQIGPQVRFAVNGIDVAPNSGGNSVLAVGNGGKLARWNGTDWREVTTPNTSDLNRVAFVTGSVAYVVGRNRTALTVRPSSGQVLSVNLSGSGSANLIGVSGRSETNVMLADDSGGWWRLTGLGWTNGTLPGGDGPYAMKAAYLDESSRERIVGLCGSGSSARSCVGYRFQGGGTPLWTVHKRFDSLGYDAVGGSFDVPTSTTGSEALTGQSDNDVVSHTNNGNFSSLTISPSLDGDGVVGVAAQNAASGRSVYVLTSSAGTTGVGHLYRLESSSGSVSSTSVLDTYTGEEVLSPNEATGVIVAEVRRARGVNNIFRRSVLVNEALDVGDDLVGASTDMAGSLVVAGIFGDVFVRRSGNPTWDYRRPTQELSIRGFEARNGLGVLLAGKDLNSSDGLIYRLTLTGGYSQLALKPSTTFNAVCRVSDSEGWVVGSGGSIYAVTGTGATAATSPTTETLTAVDCAMGAGVACGANGAVLMLTNGQWTTASPAFPVAGRAVTTCKLGPNGRVYAGGDGFFYKLEAGAWSQLAPRASLTQLVVRAPNEIYGVATAGGQSDVYRFDGAAWSASLARVTGTLGGGVQIGARVVFGGTTGVVVEGR